jgi:hypothetical protein
MLGFLHEGRMKPATKGSAQRLACILPCIPVAGIARQSGADWVLSLACGAAAGLALRFAHTAMRSVGIRFVYLLYGERRPQPQHRFGPIRFAKVSTPVTESGKCSRIGDRVLCHQVSVGAWAMIIMLKRVAVPSPGLLPPRLPRLLDRYGAIPQTPLLTVPAPEDMHPGTLCADISRPARGSRIHASPVPVPALHADGDPGAQTPTRRLPAEFRPAEAEAEALGPRPLRPALSNMARLARGSGGRQAGDGHCMETPEVRTALGEAMSIKEAQATGDSSRDPRSKLLSAGQPTDIRHVA